MAYTIITNARASYDGLVQDHLAPTTHEILSDRRKAYGD